MNIQNKFKKANVIYKITKDYDLEGGTLIIPVGCTLDFQGGSFKNGTIVGNDTKIETEQEKIFNEDIIINGSWNVSYINSNWFKNSNKKDVIKQLVNFTNDDVQNTIIIESGNYSVSVPKNIHNIEGNAAFYLKSNTNLIINGTISLVDSPYRATVIISTNNKNNIKISGSGTLVGNKINMPSTVDGEFGHGIYVTGNNIEINDIKIKDCWGDAILIGNEITHNISSNITIQNVELFSCRRQGISVLYGKNIYIKNCLIHDIKGIEKAEAGIDLEISYNWQSIEQIIIENCTIYNCAGINSWVMYTPTENEDIYPIHNIEIKNNKIYDTTNRAINLRKTRNSIISNNRISVTDYSTVVAEGNRVTIDNNTLESIHISSEELATIVTSGDSMVVCNNTVSGYYFMRIAPNTVCIGNNIKTNYLFHLTSSTSLNSNIILKNNIITCIDFEYPFLYGDISDNIIKTSSFKIINGYCIIRYNNITLNADNKSIYLGQRSMVKDNYFILRSSTVVNVYGESNIDNNSFLNGMLQIEEDNVSICNNKFINGTDRFINVKKNVVIIFNNTFTRTSGSVERAIFIEGNNLYGIMIFMNTTASNINNLVQSNGTGNKLNIIYNRGSVTPTEDIGKFVIKQSVPLFGNTKPDTTGFNNVLISFFDKSINKPIWWTGTKWVDATGTEV